MSRSSSRHRREIQGIDSAGQYPPEFGEVPNDTPVVPLNRLLEGDLTVGEDPSGTTLKYGYVEGEFGEFTGADIFSTVAVAEDISYNPNVVLMTKHGTGYGQLLAQLPDFDVTITMEWVPLNNQYEVKHNVFRNRIEAANGTTLPIRLYLPELPDPVTTTWTPEINGNLVGYDVDAYGAIGMPDKATRFTTNRNSPGLTVLRPADGAWYGGYVEVYVAETDTTLGMIWDTSANWWWCEALAFGNDIYDNYAGQELTITVTAVESVQEGPGAQTPTLPSPYNPEGLRDYLIGQSWATVVTPGDPDQFMVTVAGSLDFNFTWPEAEANSYAEILPNPLISDIDDYFERES